MRGTIVGRAQELETLVARLDQVREGGRGQAVLISGDAGLGKTTLLDEVFRVAANDGMAIMRGRAFPLDANVPYAPVVSALGHHLRRRPDDERAELVAGLGALGLIFDELPVAATVLSADPALQRTRLYESVARLVARLCDRAPVVLALDDLHWADQSSTELLQHLTRDLTALPLLIVVTSRPAELEARAWTRSFVRSLRKAGDLDEVTLAPFSRDELREMIVGSTVVEPDDAVVDFLETRSAGVPFYAEVLLRDALDRGALAIDGDACVLIAPPGEPPSEIRDEIRDRFVALSAAARLVIDVLAVSGDPMPASVLRDALGQLAPDAIDGLAPLVHRGIVREATAEDPARCELAHPLYAEVAYTDLTAIDRQRLHVVVATALERAMSAGATVAPMSLARHWRGAGDRGDSRQLADSLLKAAALASRQSALEDAAQLLTEALPVIRSTYGTREVAEALVALATTWYAIGEPAAASELLNEAVALHRSLGDDHAAAAALVRLSEVSWALGEFDLGGSQSSEAFLLREKLDDDEALAEAIFQTMVFRARAGDPFDVDALAARLDVIAERSPTPRARANAILGRLTAVVAGNDWTGAVDVIDEALELTSALGDTIMEHRAISFQIDTAMALGDHGRLALARRESSRLLAELGMSLFDHRAASTRFFEAMLTARWDEAGDHLIEWQDFAERASVPRAIAVSQASGAWLQALRGYLDESERSLAAARQALDGLSSTDLPAHSVIASMDVFIGRDLGNEERAATAGHGLRSAFIAGFPVVSVAALGYASLAAGDAERALEIATSLESCAPPRTRPIAEGARLRGIVLQRGGDGSAELRTAAETFDQLGMSYEAARTRLELRGDPDSLRSALEVFERCGAGGLADRAQSLLGGSTAKAKRASSATSSGLTPREREVAALVAEGLTNAQIAERLFISVRTVTSHLDHAYTRLGISSRAALATYITAGERPAGSST